MKSYMKNNIGTKKVITTLLRTAPRLPKALQSIFFNGILKDDEEFSKFV